MDTTRIMRSESITHLIPDLNQLGVALYGNPSGGYPIIPGNPNSILATDSDSTPAWVTALPSGITCDTPIASNSVVNKAYVDAIASGGIGSLVRLTSTSALVGWTYLNGVSGVGATLTAPSTGTFEYDGEVVNLNDRVLEKNGTGGSNAYNGVYVCTSDGTVTPGQLTRATTYDTPAEMNATGVIVAQQGDTLAGIGFFLTDVVVTIGTTPLVYSQYGNVGTVTSVGLVINALSSSGIFSVTGSPVTSSGNLDLVVTGTSGGIPYFSDANTLSSSAVLTASQLVLGGGAGSSPTSLAAGSQYQVLVMGASNPGYGAVHLDQSAAVTGILPNGNTTATAADTASTIVARDSSGNFSASTITAALSGNATSATNIAAGAANQIPYQTGAGVTSFIAAVNNAVLVTNSSGVPSESTTLPSALTIPSPTLSGTITTALTLGQVVATNILSQLVTIAYTSAGAASALNISDSNANTTVNSLTVGLTNQNSNYSGSVSGVSTIIQSGTSLTQIPDSNAAGMTAGKMYFVKSAAGGTFSLKNTSGSLINDMDPSSFVIALNSSISAGANAWNSVYIPASSQSTLPLRNIQRDANANAFANNYGANTLQTTSASSTTVLTLASERNQILLGTQTQTYQMPDVSTLPIYWMYNFTNKSTQSAPINSSGGNLILTLASGATVSMFSNATSGTDASVWTTTFQSSLATSLAGGVLGSVPYQSAANTTSFLAPNTSTTLQVLTETGTGSAGQAPAWVSAVSTNTASTLVFRDASGNFSAGTITATLSGSATNATNILGGALGSIPYQSAANTTALLAGNITTTQQVLAQTGNGSVSAAPVWLNTTQSGAASSLIKTDSNQFASINAPAFGYVAPGGTYTYAANGPGILNQSSIATTKMPDTTQIPVGSHYRIYSTASNFFNLQTSAGSLLDSLIPFSISFLTSTSQSGAGNWAMTMCAYSATAANSPWSDVTRGSDGGAAANYFAAGSNVSSTGNFRVPTSGSFSFRNQANSGDVAIAKDSSDNLTYPNSMVLSALTASQAVVTDSSKKLISLAYTTAATASALVQRDANGNIFANNGISAYTTTATAFTATLTASSTYWQEASGVSTAQYTLPDATTLFVGWVVKIVAANSGSTMTIKNNATTTILSFSGTNVFYQFGIRCTSTATAAGTWEVFDVIAPIIPVTIDASLSGINSNAGGSAMGRTGSGSFFGANHISISTNTASTSAMLRAASSDNIFSIRNNANSADLTFAKNSSDNLTWPNTILLSALTASQAVATDSNKNLVSVANTGTGNNVLATSPTITTPAIVGLTTGSTPSSGNVGEVLTSSVASGSAVSLTTATVTDITSLAYTAGNWLVICNPTFSGTGITATELQSFVGTASGNSTTGQTTANTSYGTPFAVGVTAQDTTPIHFTYSSSSSGTLYLKAKATFSVGTCTAYGAITMIRLS